MRYYDPPSGWRYGFPKAYRPLPNETLADTLRRDGYPEQEIKWGGAEHVRFWQDEPSFCKHCGSGIGVFKRDGEQSCPECKKFDFSA